MTTEPFSSRSSRRFASLAACAYLAFLAINHSSHAQSGAAEPIVVTGEELPTAYEAPVSFSQSRFSPITNAYVLPPGAIYASLIYEDAVVHFRRPDHDFTLETEAGLPYRINVAMETDVEHYGDETQLRSFSIEARYAFADWNKIPLNPTIFAEYKFGGGRILHDEGPPTPGHKFGPGGFDTTMETPDAYELRLLLSQDFFDKGIRGTPYNSFVIGPTIAWRPSRNTRLDVSPLFGVNHKSPEVQFFAVLSYYFGGGSSKAEGGEAPASTRNR